MLNQKARFDLGGVLSGMKTILSRNALLIIAINVLSTYANSMKNSFRTVLGMKELGLSATVIGTALTIATIVTVVMRAPSGAVTDHLRKWLKRILAASTVLRMVAFFGYTVISSQTGYYAVFVLDAITLSFNSTVIPAVLALSIDRRAMGSGYAVMLGAAKIIAASARQVSLGLYKTGGVSTVVNVTHVLHIVMIVLALCMSEKALVEANEKKSAAAQKPRRAGVAGKVGILWAMIPLSLIAALAGVQQSAFENNFFPMFAETYAIPFTDITTLGGSISGFLGIFIGFLCDLINPAFLLVFSLGAQILCPFLWMNVEAAGLVRIGLFISYIIRYHGTVFRILGMKAVSKADQGSFSATYMMTNNIVSGIVNTLIGLLVDGLGYSHFFYVLAGINIFTFVAFVLLYRFNLKKLIESSLAPAADKKAPEVSGGQQPS